MASSKHLRMPTSGLRRECRARCCLAEAMGSLDESQQARQFLHERAVANAWGARRAAEVTEIPFPLALALCSTNTSSSGRNSVLPAVAARILIEATWGSEERGVK